MENVIKLKNPILVNEEKIEDLSYDANEITAQLFAQADVKKKQAAGIKNVSISPAIEFDFALHLYVGFAAVIARNPKFDFSDLERIKGNDLMGIIKIGRNFLLGSEEDGNQSSLDEPSETTAGHTEQT